MKNISNSSSAKPLKTVEWKNDRVILIDQTKLPTKLSYLTLKSYTEVAYAIKNLQVRGAPAIGVTAAFGLALVAVNDKSKNITKFKKDLQKALQIIKSTRPTAVNLHWALDRIMNKALQEKDLESMKKIIIMEAKKMAEEDLYNNRQIGRFGSPLIQDGEVILTHCNAGSLATVGYGTALGVIRAVKEAGKNISVIATETRPVMQGARLTAFELKHEGIDVSLIPDTAVGHLMSRGDIKHVIVGADRILRTGHVFNKIGTYQIAILANIHKIPLYVVAPSSTFDLLKTPDDVIIEERSHDEVVKIGKKRIAPKGIKVFNPAFDMTPPEFITLIITEKGIIRPPFEKNISKIIK